MVLGDTKSQNEVSRQSHQELPLHTWVNSAISQWVRNTSLQMVVNEAAQFPESNKEEQSNKVLLHEPDSNTSDLP
jgi:hypothetical protein